MLRALAAFSVSIVMLGSVVSAEAAQPEILNLIPRPVSHMKAQNFKAADWQKFRATFPHRPGNVSINTANAAPGPGAVGFWTPVTTVPNSNVGLCNPELLHDGTVIAQDCDAPDWWKLTPDNTGSYSNGTWTEIASLPVIGGVQYAPLYHTSAVLPDGRLFIMGGEYNGNQNNGNGVWTNLAAIYDPVGDTWTAVNPPANNAFAFGSVGDAESIVLPNGTLLQAPCCAYPDADAYLDATNLTWKPAPAPNAGIDYQDEQGYTLMQNGNVLTIDIWTSLFNGGATPRNAEQFNTATGWGAAGFTTVSLVDPYECATFEIGPAVTRVDGTVLAFGGNTGCTTPSVDPTEIYNITTQSWSRGPNVPMACAGNYCDLADAPAAVLPNGNVLFAASPGYGNSPTKFFEVTPDNKIVFAPSTADGPISGAYWYNFLVLPSGQVLETDFSGTPEVFTALGAGAGAGAPTISTAPSTVHAGNTYALAGTQFNGLTQGAAYGDDYQSATNYPIVRITNNATGHVSYATTSNYNTMSIAPGTASSCKFTVPAGIETGLSQLVVIANGNPSSPVTIRVYAANR